MTDHQRGLALIAVLWGLVLLALIAASVTATSRTETRLAHNLVANAEAQALAEAGVHRAVLGLVAAAPEQQLRVDGTPYRLVFAGGEVLLNIRDEGGKIDLNRAPDTLIKGLFTAAGVDAGAATALVDAIVDYRDANHASRLNGAEDNDYRSRGRPHGAKDAPFEAVDELLHVLGMTPELYEQVAPAFTVYSRRRRVDPATAPELVLLALPGLDPAELDQRRGQREEAEDEPVELLEEDGGGIVGTGPAAPGSPRRSVQRRRGRVVTVRAEARTVSGVIFVREAVVRIGRSARAPMRMAAWRQGTAAAAPAPMPE